MKKCYKFILFSFIVALILTTIALCLNGTTNMQKSINFCKVDLTAPNDTQNLILDEPMGEPIINGENIKDGNDNKDKEKPKDKQKIKVTGNGVISVTPEVAKISFAIETLADTMTNANTSHQAKAKTLLSALKDYNVVSTYYNCYPIYNYENEKHLTGYEIYSNYELTTENLNAINDIIDLILVNGGTNINNVEYYLKDDSNKYYSALSLALNDAQTKASALIDSDMHLTIKSIKEQNYFYRPYKLSVSLNSNTNARNSDIATLEAKDEIKPVQNDNNEIISDLKQNENGNELNNYLNKETIEEQNTNLNESNPNLTYKNIEITANIEVEFIVSK